jgi:hypothetical protein
MGYIERVKEDENAKKKEISRSNGQVDPSAAIGSLKRETNPERRKFYSSGEAVISRWGFSTDSLEGNDQ